MMKTCSRPFHWLFAVLLASLASCNRDDPQRDDYPGSHIDITLSVGDLDREFVLYLPSTRLGNEKLPLIYVLHGGKGKPESMMELADFRPIAERDTVALVYPQGLDKSWNDGRSTKSGGEGVDDVDFFRQMSIYLRDNYSIDTARMYATGISNGGFMCSRLACELSDWIAAIAVDAATIEANTISLACNPSRPIPALYIHGTEDELVPIAGGEMSVGAGGFILSHSAALSLWATHNDCDSIPTITDLPDLDPGDGTTIRETRFTNGTGGTEVVGYVITGGGHTWPQGKQYLGERTIGKTSQDMNACEEVWGFLRRWRR